MVAVVGSISNNTSLTLTSQVSNNGLVGTGFKIDRLKYPYQAYNDILNSNVVAYWNSDMARFDTYDSYQIKVVFISDNDKIVPKMADLRCLATSA
jgi:hypothetical protein